jgi:inhibitor of KinA
MIPDDHLVALQPLGDQGVLAYLADEAAALALAAALRAAPLPWLVDVVSSYRSVAVYYDLDRVNYDRASAAVRQAAVGLETAALALGVLHHIPCCYEAALDMERVTAATGLPAAEVIRLHSMTEYTVYAIGFCPGFPYLGYLPEPLCDVPRLESPRLRVEAGSVGLTGRQTGIYTEARPGGWNLIGRTPLTLVDVETEYFPLRTGDRVQFVPIDRAEFERLQGRRLG